MPALLLVFALLAFAQEPSIPDAYVPARGNPGLDVEHYRLELFLLPPSVQAHGRADLRVQLLDESPELRLDLHEALRVRRVGLDGAPAAFRQEPGKLVVELGGHRPAGSRLALAVDYGGKLPAPHSQGEPVGLLSDGFGLVAYLEPDGAHHWFPCNDHPSDKATFEILVTVPAGDVAAATGGLRAIDLLPGFQRFTWGTDRPMATYLTSLAAGPYRLIQRPGPVPILDLAWPRDVERVRERLAVITPMMQFLVARLGEYPFERYGHVLLNLPVGGMENQTMTVLGRMAGLSGDPDLLVHEAAHQWFGNWVSPRRWQDLWLNEGWASYLEYLWAVEAEPEGNHARRILRGWRRATLALAARNEAWSLAQPDPEDLFGGLVYAKGGLVVHLLARYLGEESFFHAVRAYLHQHGGGNVTTTDLERSLSAATGQDLQPFFDAWVRSPHLPRVRLTWSSAEESDGWKSHVRLEQVQKTPWHPFAARVALRDGNGAERVLTLTFRDRAAETTATTSFQPAEAVLDPRKELPILPAP